ncbi:unnamed protein product [Rotaria magnacalcarata]|uniref:Nuclear pore complex protein n=8 Tax=Rotaria magnacalcarata TaxID=392030 RepID=A0A816XU71_9BILA|nr:unnamed protein product [Rotaria magnacalcarata]CAF3897664.1 unnamed protein product [Rotaria magnacalcarata]
MSESIMNVESTVIDGSFTQPLESTRLPQTSNWSPNNTTIRSSKTIPCVTKSEQQLYKLYAQALADSEVTQDWSSWVEMMAINCQKCCSEAEISHPIAFRTGRQTQLSRNIRMLQVERDSWLLWNRARDTLNNTRQDLPEVIPGSSDRLIVEHHLINDPQLRMAKAVQGWLQAIKLDERYQADVKMAMTKLEPKRIYWEKTCHFLKSSYNANLPNPYITCLDFDATHKQKRRLCDTDEQEENDLLQIVFSLLRVGEYSKAKNICKSTGYHWLAALLSANELYHDENYYCSEANDIVYPVEGNQKRIQWIESMYELSMDMRLKLYERAIYGLLCGRIEALIPVCKTYADYLWAYTSCYIEQEIHYILIRAHEHELTDIEKHRVLSDHGLENRQLRMPSIFDEILVGCPTHIRDEAVLPFNAIQKYLILADYDRLFHSILSFLHTNNESNGSLLRFASHICLFLYEQNHSEKFNQNTFIEILTTYIHHLIELEFKDLVCYYISKLPPNDQSTIMAKFLDTLSNRQDKEFYLKQGFTYKIDIDTSLLILAANQRRDQTFDKENNDEIISTNSKSLNENDHKQLEALKLLTTFLSTQTLDALRFANLICRYFLNDAKYEGIRISLSYFPHDIDVHTIEANNRQQSEDDIREFKAFGAYIAALEAIQRWSELHQKQQENTSTATREDQAYLPIVIKACYEVFDYPQGWLVDITNVHQTLPDNENRQIEMSILRHKYIPMLACNLFRIFDLIKHEQETFRLIIFLSDSRKQQLYKLFSKETLNSVLLLTEHAAERCLDRQQQSQTGDITVNLFL